MTEPVQVMPGGLGHIPMASRPKPANPSWGTPAYPAPPVATAPPAAWPPAPAAPVLFAVFVGSSSLEHAATASAAHANPCNVNRGPIRQLLLEDFWAGH